MVKSGILLLLFGRLVLFDSFATPWTIAHQAPLSKEFSGQEYWSGLPFPSPGYLPNSGTEPRSPALQVDSLPSEPLGKPSSAKKKKPKPSKWGEAEPGMGFSLCTGGRGGFSARGPLSRDQRNRGHEQDGQRPQKRECPRLV